MLAFPFPGQPKPASLTAGSLQFAELFQGPDPAVARGPLSTSATAPGAAAAGRQQGQSLTDAVAAARPGDGAPVSNGLPAERSAAASVPVAARQSAVSSDAAAVAGHGAGMASAPTGDIGSALDRLIAEAMQVCWS